LIQPVLDGAGPNLIVGIVYDTISAMRVVLDTSVIVAALRSRLGASFEILRRLRAGRFGIVLSVPLALEYESILIRHAGELGLAMDDAVALVDYLCAVARPQEVHYLWRPSLGDPQDEFVLELAVAAGCEAIVTHNVRDFQAASRFGVAVLRPAEFLVVLAEGR
jgi:predicted nucleic acid-binding protein